ncbi:hypothetical protein [Dactylosporangium salmoneum]|uniref:hypothetical protein n=1 Tax=Dactylosporangium salmoneum TaxID=53361 RepID=UPI003CD07C7E
MLQVVRGLYRCAVLTALTVLLAALLGHRPDASIVDVRLPPTQSDEGLQAALAARREVPGLPVLILSQFLSEGAISKYTTTIFAKLGLAADDDTNRRVRAVLAYLDATAP